MEAHFPGSTKVERKFPVELIEISHYATLREKLPMIGAKRLILTHMSPDMLGRVSELVGRENLPSD